MLDDSANGVQVYPVISYYCPKCIEAGKQHAMISTLKDGDMQYHCVLDVSHRDTWYSAPRTRLQKVVEQMVTVPTER